MFGPLALNEARSPKRDMSGSGPVKKLKPKRSDLTVLIFVARGFGNVPLRRLSLRSRVAPRVRRELQEAGMEPEKWLFGSDKELMPMG
jgi:hypothetical protein